MTAQQALSQQEDRVRGLEKEKTMLQEKLNNANRQLGMNEEERRDLQESNHKLNLTLKGMLSFLSGIFIAIIMSTLLTPYIRLPIVELKKTGHGSIDTTLQLKTIIN